MSLKRPLPAISSSPGDPSGVWDGRPGLEARFHMAQHSYAANRSRVSERRQIFFESTPGLEALGSPEGRRGGGGGGASAVKYLAGLTGRDPTICRGRPTTGDVALDRLAAPLMAIEPQVQSPPARCFARTRRQRKAGSTALRYISQLSGSLQDCDISPALPTSELSVRDCPPDCIDLTHRCLQAEDIYRTTRACIANPRITTLDLSHSWISKHAFNLVVQALRDSPDITEVRADPLLLSCEGGPVPEKYRTRLEAQLQANRERKRVSDTQAHHRHRYREAVRRKNFFGAVLAYIGDDEACRRHELQKEEKTLRTALHRERTAELGRVDRQLLRAAHRFERKRHVGRLFAVEQDHRLELERRWIRVWLPLAERLETRVRQTHIACCLSGFSDMRVLAIEDRREKTQSMRQRLERELCDRTALEDTESLQRRGIEVAAERLRTALQQQEAKAFKTAQEHCAQRAELVREEENRYNRGKVLLEEAEARGWIVRKWELEERRRTEELEQQRVVVMSLELDARSEMRCAEEEATDIVGSLMEAAIAMQRLREVKLISVGAIQQCLALPPAVLLSSPPEQKPPKYITRQHEAVPRSTPPLTSVLPATSLSVSLPAAWEAELEGWCDATKRTRPDLDAQRSAYQEAAERMGSLSPDVAAMFSDTLQFIDTHIVGDDDPREDISFDTQVLKQRKERVLGGRVAFRMLLEEEPPQQQQQCPFVEALSLAPEAESESDEEVEEGDDRYEVLPVGCGVWEPLPGGGGGGDGGDVSLSVIIPRNTPAAAVEELIRRCVFSTTQVVSGVPIVRTIEVSVRLDFVRSCDAAQPFLLGDDPDTEDPPTLSVEAHTVCHVVLCCPYLWLPPEAKPATFIEGDTMEKISVLPEPAVTDSPIISMHNGVLTAASATVSGMSGSLVNFEGGKLTLEFTGGYTPDDIFAFKSGSEVAFEDGKRMMCRDTCMALVTEGHPAKVVPDATFVYDEGCGKVCMELGPASAEVVKKILIRFRYYNVSLDPVEGPRTITVTLEDASGARSTIVSHVMVKAVDNPATLTVPLLKKHYHSMYTNASVPAHLRSYLRIRDFRPYYDAIVEDVDTELFCGGHLAMSISANFQRGDLLGFPEACYEPSGYQGLQLRPACPEDPEFGEVGPGSCDGYENLWDVHYLGTRVAVMGFYDAVERRGRTLEEELDAEPTDGPTTPRVSPGLSMRRRQSNAGLMSSRMGSIRRQRVGGGVVFRFDLLNNPQDGRSGRHVCVQFSLSGTASLDAARTVMRNICFLPVVKAGEYNRVIDMELQAGLTVGKPDSFGQTSTPDISLIEVGAFQPALKASVTVRVTSPLCTIGGKSSLLRYTEGAGSLRLASFDTANDMVTDGYEGGYIRAELVSGTCDDDSIGFREEGLVLKVRDVLESPLPFPVVVAHSDRYEEEKMGWKLPKRLHDDDADIDTLQSFYFRKGVIPTPKTKDVVVSAPMRFSISEVYCESKFIGILTSSRSALQLNFVRSLRAEKEKLIGRREVSAILRAITYSNTSKDPQMLTKIIRVQVSDGSPLPSQAIVEVQIQPVDDVTDIFIRNDRLRYRPCDDDVSLPFLIAPLGEADVDDPDTSFFDGGFLSAEISSGASKGDQLSLLTLEQQKRQLASLGDMSAVYASLNNGVQKTRPVRRLECPEDFLFEVTEDKRIVSVSGRFAAGLTFPQTKNCKDAHDVRVSFPVPQAQGGEVFSLEAVTYILNCFTFASSMREKLREGARTVVVKVADRFNPQHGKARLTVDVRLPFVHQPTKVPVPVMPGGSVLVSPKLVVNHSENLGMIVAGFLELEASEGHVEGDALSLNYRDGGFTVKEGLVYNKNLLVAVLAVSSPVRLRLEFHSNTKATAKFVASLLRSVSYKFSSESGSAPRVVRISGTYDRLDRVNTELVHFIPKK